MSDELIPCPFCGSDDIETFYNRSGVDHYTCQYCGATAKDWNTRHESGELPEWAKEAIENEISVLKTPIKHTGGISIRSIVAVKNKSEMIVNVLNWILSLRKPENK